MGQLVLVEIEGVQSEVDLDRLVVEDLVEVGENYRKVSTEYRLDGVVVKRTVSVDGLRMAGATHVQGKLS